MVSKIVKSRRIRSSFSSTSSSSFKVARFSPEQANVRKEFFLKNLDPNGDLADLKSEEDEDELTPRYSSQLLADILARENNAYIKKAFNESNSLFFSLSLIDFPILIQLSKRNGIKKHMF